MLTILANMFLGLIGIVLILAVVLFIVMIVNCILRLLDDTIELWNDLTEWFPDEEG
jgi:hypothetical protein